MHYQDTLNLQRSFAWRVKRRAMALGASTLQFDDIMQELAIAWCKARDTFDPQAGASFSTYFRRGMELHIRGFMRDRLTRQNGSDFDTWSLDAFVSEDSNSFHEVTPSAEPSPHEITEGRDLVRAALGQLSNRSKVYLTLLIDTPPALAAEVRKIQTRQEYARSRGITVTIYQGLCSSVIFDLMGASRFERTAIMREVRDVTENLCQE